MILTASSDGTGVEVAELKDSPQGAPLLAKASGEVTLGDRVLAINGHVLGRHGTVTLAQVAAEFKAAPRPVTVLFHRQKELVGSAADE
jgi:translation initiation factor 2B subunit (eIF-2B alpha/beta/delta family)